MYLKKIDIYGFKSFAEKIEISFKDGITAIVGPNGSGKSNILDAIKWVLGEQKVKSLRGHKMEDVIFSGTQIRKPLGYAEVTLTINNSTGKFPIEFDELSVTRRLFRSGDSEFYINKSRCRLKDIHDLFVDTGLGKEGYSIIGQGKIDHIVSSNSVERRLLLEEAAGIVKYKNRKVESERKLEKTQENLYRISDIIIELEKQLTPLHNQSKKAKVYLDLRENLKKVELNLFVHKTEEINQDLKKLKSDKDILVKNIEDKEKQLQTKDDHYQQLRKETNDLEEKIAGISEKILLLNKNIEEKNTQIQVSLTKIEFNNKTINSIESELVQIEDSKAQVHYKSTIIQQQLKEVEDELIENNKELQSYCERKEILNQQQQELTEKHRKKEESLEFIQNNISQLNNKIDLLKNKTNYYTEHISNLEQRLQDTYFQKEQQHIKKTDLIKHERDVHQRIKIINDAITEKKQYYENYKSKYTNQEKQLQVYENNYQVLQSKFNMMDNNEELKGYYHSVRLLLKEKSTNPFLSKNLHDIVGNLLKVDKSFSLAIETALGNSVQNLVAENEQVAHECIKLLNKNKWGRATFLPLNIISGDMTKVSPDVLQEDGFIDVACNLIEYKQQYNKLFLNLLGRVLVVRDFDSGIKISKKTNYRFKIVTLKGEIFYPGGAMVGGANQKNNNRNIIQKKQELRDLQEEMKATDKKVKAIKKEQNTLLGFVQESNKAVEAIKLQSSELIMENKLTEQNLIQISNLITENEDVIIKIKSEIDKYKNEQQSCLQEIEQANKSKLSFHDEQKFMDEKEVAMDVEVPIEEEIKKIDKKIIDLNLHIAKLEEKQVHLYNQNTDIAETNNNQGKQINEKKKQLTDIQQENKKLTFEITEMEQQSKFMKEENNNLEKEHDYYQQNKSSKNNQFDSIQKDIKTLNSEHMVMNDILNKLDIKINNKKYELQNLQENIFENYATNYIMACDFRYNIDNMQQELKLAKSYKDQLKGLGSVNVDAIEQYKEVKDRYEFLTLQRDDLTKAREELLNIIQEITINMENQFIEKFKQIQEGFNHTFKQLFNGGSARLLIEDNDNLMETGIEIEAQPPGKKLKNISLLSGGEKSLTAIALLFAIITIKPTPFCVLDEIDAALDDSNVERFSKYLNTVSKENQFITITHRKGTMEIADRMYGVSMGNDGVSKVLSVELTDILEEEVQVNNGT